MKSNNLNSNLKVNINENNSNDIQKISEKDYYKNMINEYLDNKENSQGNEDYVKYEDEERFINNSRNNYSDNNEEGILNEEDFNDNYNDENFENRGNYNEREYEDNEFKETRYRPIFTDNKKDKVQNYNINNSLQNEENEDSIINSQQNFKKTQQYQNFNERSIENSSEVLKNNPNNNHNLNNENNIIKSYNIDKSKVDFNIKSKLEKENLINEYNNLQTEESNKKLMNIQDIDNNSTNQQKINNNSEKNSNSQNVSKTNKSHNIEMNEYDYNDDVDEGIEDDNENENLENHDNEVYENTKFDSNQNEVDNIQNLEDLNKESINNEKFDDFSLNKIDDCLKKIFEYYAFNGEKLNLDYMGSFKFHKFAVDANIIGKSINKTKLDLIFSKATLKSCKMNFNSFTKSLVYISQELYFETPLYSQSKRDANKKSTKHYQNTLLKKEGLVQLFDSIIFPLYFKLFKNEEKETQNENSLCLSERISEPEEIISDRFLLNNYVTEVLQVSTLGLYRIYKTYFSHELSLSRNEKFIKEESLKQYTQFIKDFEIIPSLVSKSICLVSYLNLICVDVTSEEAYLNLLPRLNLSFNKYNVKKSQLVGTYFTFYKFVRLIVRLSIASFVQIEKSLSSKENVKIDLFEKLIYLLEKIEASSGFINLELKTNLTHTDKTSKILDSNEINYIRQNYRNETSNLSSSENNNDFKNKFNFNDSKNKNRLPTSLSGKETEVNSPIPFTQTNNITEKNLLSNSKEKILFEFILKNYNTMLLQIFEVYCSYGKDDQENKLLKSNNFLKLLRNSNMVESGVKNVNKINSNIMVKSNEVDIIFTHLIKLSDKKANYKLKAINYHEFIKGLILISYKFDKESDEENFNNIESILKYIIEERIIKNNSIIIEKYYKNDEKIDLLEALKQESEEDISLINVLSISFQQVYLFYSNYNVIDSNIYINTNNSNNTSNKFQSISKKDLIKNIGLMTKEQLLNFANDFSLFPDIISKSKLIYYFKKKSLEIQNDIQSKYHIYDTELIDYSGFLDLLGLIAIELPLNDEPFINRVNTLMDHINLSGGEEKIFRRNGIRISSITNIYKKKLPEYFNQNETNRSVSISEMYDILKS